MFHIIIIKLFRIKLSSTYSILNIYLVSVILSILFIIGGIFVIENKSYFQRKENAINSKYDCGYGSFGQCLETEISKSNAEFFSVSVTESKLLAAVLISFGVINIGFETHWLSLKYVKN